MAFLFLSISGPDKFLTIAKASSLQGCHNKVFVKNITK